MPFRKTSQMCIIHVYLVYNISQLQKYINVYVILCNNVWFSLVLYNYSGHEVILQYVKAKCWPYSFSLHTITAITDRYLMLVCSLTEVTSTNINILPMLLDRGMR